MIESEMTEKQYPGSIKIYFNPDIFTFSDYYLMRDSLAGFDWPYEVEYGDNFFKFSELKPHQARWINNWLKTEHAKKVCGVKRAEMKE